MTFTDEKVTTTIVDIGHLFASIVSFDADDLFTRTDEGLLSYHLTFQAAEDAILSYISKPSNQRPAFLVRFGPNKRPFSPSNAHAHAHAHAHAPLPDNILTDPDYSQDYNRIKVRLSNDAWEYLQKQTRYFRYDGRDAAHGCTHFLLALFNANPGPTDWQDTRPNNLQQYDSILTKLGRFPYWSSAQDTGLNLKTTRRLQRTLNPTHIALMLPTLTALSDHFMIAPYSTGQLSALRRALTVLECYGLGYLTPLHHPAPCPRPANEDKRRYRATRLRNQGPELVF